MARGPRGRGRPRADPSSDVWYGIEDSRERKKIQDRLAQRARRQRLHQRRSDTSTESDEDNSKSSIVALQKVGRPTPPGPNLHVTASDERVMTLPPSMPQFVNYAHMKIPKFAWPICSALAYHGILQSTSCESCMLDMASPPEYLALPEALRPSQLQLAVKHRNWIDRFPFPRLRDNMILLADQINLDAFVWDLFNMPSLTLRPSGEKCTWKPTSWAIEREFARKWGFLFLTQAKLFNPTLVIS